MCCNDERQAARQAEVTRNQIRNKIYDAELRMSRAESSGDPDALLHAYRDWQVWRKTYRNILGL